LAGELLKTVRPKNKNRRFEWWWNRRSKICV